MRYIFVQGNFLKFVVLLLLVTSMGLQAKEPNIEIKQDKEFTEVVQGLPPQEKKQVEDAIKVGNKFMKLYYSNRAWYDIEIEDEWNKTFNPLTTISGEKMQSIIFNEVVYKNNNEVFATGCQNIHLNVLSYENNTTLLTYKVFTVCDYPMYHDDIDAAVCNESTKRVLYFRLVLDSNKITDFILLSGMNAVSYGSIVNYKSWKLRNSDFTTTKSIKQLKDNYDAVMQSVPACKNY